MRQGRLPGYFKQILWFGDLGRMSLEEDKETILFQTLEKGRMEHLKYLERKIGGKAILDFARKNAKRFSRKSIVPFIEAMYSK